MKRRYLLGSLWLCIAVLLCGILIGHLGYSKMSWDSIFERLAEKIEKSKHFNKSYSYSKSWNSEDNTTTTSEKFSFDYNLSLGSDSDRASLENGYFVQNIESVKVELHSIPLEVVQAEDTMIHADAFGEAEKFCTFTKYGDKLVIKEKKGFGWGEKKKKAHIKLALPKDFDGKTDIESVSGSIRVSGLEFDKLDIESVSGSIVLSDCKIGELKTESVSGSQKIDGSFDKINAESVSGSVDFTTSKPLSKDSDFSAISGSVKLDLPKSSDYEAEFQTISGSFRDDITGVSRKKNGVSRNGRGGVKIDISTISGSIKIQ